MLAKIPGRDALAAAISKNSEAVTPITSLQIAGALIFTERRPPGANTTELYVREGLSGTDRLLIDPQHFATPDTHAALDWWAASPDGTQNSLRPLGGRLRTFRAACDGHRDRHYHAACPYPHGRCQPQLAAGRSGFFYNRFQDVPPDDLRIRKIPAPGCIFWAPTQPGTPA